MNPILKYLPYSITPLKKASDLRVRMLIRLLHLCTIPSCYLMFYIVILARNLRFFKHFLVIVLIKMFNYCS